MESKTFFVQVTFHGGMLQLLIYSECRPQENSNEGKGKNFFLISNYVLSEVMF